MEGENESGVYSTQIGRWSDFLLYLDIFKRFALFVLGVILFISAFVTRKISQFLDFLSEHYKVEDHLRMINEEKIKEFIEQKFTIKNEELKIKNCSNDNLTTAIQKNNDQQVIASTTSCSVRSQNGNQDLNDIKESDTNTLAGSALSYAESIQAVKTAIKKENIDLSVLNNTIENNKILSNNDEIAELKCQDDFQHNTITLPTNNVDNNKDFLLNEFALKMNIQESVIQSENVNLTSASCCIESNLEPEYKNFNCNEIKDDKCLKTEEKTVLSKSCNIINDSISKNDVHLQLNEEKSNSINSETLSTPLVSPKREKSSKSRSPIHLITKTLLGNINGEYNKKVELDVVPLNNVNTHVNGELTAKPPATTEIVGGNRQTTPKNERSINFVHSKEEISSLPNGYALARFITADFLITPNTAIDFQTKYGCTWGELLDQKLKKGDVGVVVNNNQYIFFLILKNKNDHQRMEPVFIDNAVLDLANRMKQLKLTKLAVCTMASGIQQFNWTEIKTYFNKYFFGSNISVTACFMPPINEIKPLAAVNRTQLNLWDMEKQTDIIMFINLEEMYNEDWKDEVVEKIDAKYPFKNKLLHDIHIKPMAPGDVLIYEINEEVLICIFVYPFGQHKDYYKCLEKSFNTIKSLGGYRYLGIQQSLKESDCEYDDVWQRQVLLLRSIFTELSGEIWICGDTNACKILQYEDYKKSVNEAMNASSTSKSNISGYNPSPKFGSFRNASHYNGKRNGEININSRSENSSRYDRKRSGEMHSNSRLESSSRYENRRNGGNCSSRSDNGNLVTRRSNSQSSMVSRYNKTSNKQSASNSSMNSQTLNNKNNYNISSNDYSESWNN